MATPIEIDGVNLLPIKDAAKVVSYTRDYVARLAREQKIVAEQVNRQWFVDIISLKNFAEAALLEQAIRKQQLSLERKREQVVKQEVQVLKSEVRYNPRTVRLEAQMMAILVLGCGLTAGLGIHTATTLLPQPATNVAQIGMTLPLEKSLVREVVPPETIPAAPVALPAPSPVVSSSTVEQPLFVDEAETRVMAQGSAEGIFLLSENSAVEDAADVEELFSDDVAVRFLNDSTGVVSYVDGEGNVSEFPFVSVSVASNPVDTTE